MSTEEISTVKSYISEIDKKVVELQAERFTATLRLSALLARAAKDRVDPAFAVQRTRSSNEPVGGSGFAERR
jgi:hypothetical protein